MEWQAHKDSLCPGGCGQPRAESFADERSGNAPSYSAEPLDCHACAARERAAYWQNHNRPARSHPPFGQFWLVTKDDD